MRIFSLSAWAAALKASSAQPITPMMPIADRFIIPSPSGGLQRRDLRVQIEHRSYRVRARALQFGDRRVAMARRTGRVGRGRAAEAAERSDAEGRHDFLGHRDPSLRAFDAIVEIDKAEIEIGLG